MATNVGIEDSARAGAAGRGQRPAGAGQAPPLDALHPHGRLRGPRGARSSCAARAATSTTSTASATWTGSSALFCVNAGHGRAELGRGGRARRRKELGFYTNWSYAHPPRDRAGRADRRRSRPGDLNRVFFTSGGSEAVESAWKLARNYHRIRGEGTAHQADRARARLPRHHARRARGDRPHRRCARRSSRSRPAAATCRTRTATAGPTDRDPLWAADAIEERILFEGPETVAAVILEPVQNAGGCFVAAGRLLPARARDLRPPRRAADLRRGDLLVGPPRPLLRLASATATSPTSSRPRRALTSAYVADGRDDRLRPRSPSRSWRARRCSPTASRSAATRSRPRSRWRTSTSSSARTSAGTCARKEGEFRAALEGLRDLPIVGDVRGAGYFQAIELVKDQETKETLQRRGVGGPAARLPVGRAVPPRADLPRRRPRRPGRSSSSPPLIADTEQFEEIETDPARRPDARRGTGWSR